jgi:hypothetical protein
MFIYEIICPVQRVLCQEHRVTASGAHLPWIKHFPVLSQEFFNGVPRHVIGSKDGGDKLVPLYPSCHYIIRINRNAVDEVNGIRRCSS